MIGKDEWYQWGFENVLQQIIPPTLGISDVHTSNELNTSQQIMHIYKVWN